MRTLAMGNHSKYGRLDRETYKSCCCTGRFGKTVGKIGPAGSINLSEIVCTRLWSRRKVVFLPKDTHEDDIQEHSAKVGLDSKPHQI